MSDGHREQTYGHKKGEEGENGMHGASNMETYIAICKIESQWEFAVWFRELKLELCDSLEAWDGREVQEGGDKGIPMADSCRCRQKPMHCCNVIILQLKIN